MNLKHKRAPVIIIALAIYGLILTFANAKVFQDATDSERYFFTTHIIIVLVLAVYFWWLQKRDTDKMQEILDKTEERETERKQFWLNVAHIQIGAMIDTHSFAAQCGEKVLKNTETIMNERASLVIEIVHLESWSIPKLDRAMSQVADLLSDPSLFDEITHNNYYQFTALPHDLRDNLEHREKIENLITSVKERNIVFQQYRGRIKKEMPKIEPPKMKTKTTEEWS